MIHLPRDMERIGAALDRCALFVFHQARHGRASESVPALVDDLLAQVW